MLIADIQNLSASYGAQQVLEDISFQINSGDCLAIVGPMGSGKTTLAKALSGRLFRKGSVYFSARDGQSKARVIWVEQQHRFTNRSNMQEFYLQQRFNSADSDDAYTILEHLVEEKKEDVTRWLSFFHLDGLINKPLIQLSNGENKRLQLVKSLLREPDWLILDNPFLGLDVEGRRILSEVLGQLDEMGIHFILINSPAEMPNCVNRVIYLENGTLVDAPDPKDQVIFNPDKMGVWYDGFPPRPDFEVAIGMKAVNIQYGQTTIIQRLDWQVRKGEAWALSGPNGAGKSTLLSLVTADNPQAYAQNLFLFDRKRGSGESIWDIKRRIGYVSPELHLYFKEGGDVFSVVASGLFDTLGLFKKLSDRQAEQVEGCLEVLGLSQIRDRNFQQISSGEQRMVLLARALVKNPPLLILDEPCQGLDVRQIQLIKELINFLINRGETTLVYVSHYASDIPSSVQRELALKAPIS